MNQKKYWYWLSTLEGVRNACLRKLIGFYGSPLALYQSKGKMAEKLFLSERILQQLKNPTEENELIEKYNKLEEKGIYFVTEEESSFPIKLKALVDAPLFLFFKGRLPDPCLPAIAIVGARNGTSYGQAMAKHFAAELAAEKVQVISGLARGVDTWAHQGALTSHGMTFAVLGCGIDICYPKENIGTYMEIAQKGGILSEYGLGMPGLPANFPLRNRIISGLSDGILVIEAKKRSGTLITVAHGLEQGKDIYALPGKITDPYSEGCNNLIKEGARLVTTSSEIMEELMLRYPRISFTHSDKIQNSPTEKSNNLLARDEKIVYAMLSLEPKHIETLFWETGLRMNELTAALASLEVKGYIRQTSMNYYLQHFK